MIPVLFAIMRDVVYPIQKLKLHTATMENTDWSMQECPSRQVQKVKKLSTLFLIQRNRMKKHYCFRNGQCI